MSKVPTRKGCARYFEDEKRSQRRKTQRVALNSVSQLNQPIPMHHTVTAPPEFKLCHLPTSEVLAVGHKIQETAKKHQETEVAKQASSRKSWEYNALWRSTGIFGSQPIPLKQRRQDLDQSQINNQSSVLEDQTLLREDFQTLSLCCYLFGLASQRPRLCWSHQLNQIARTDKIRHGRKSRKTEVPCFSA